MPVAKKTAVPDPSTVTETALAKVEPQQVAVTTKINYADDAGSGLENVTVDDFLIPRLLIAQDMTAATKSREAAFIPGLEVGMIFDPITNEFWDAANDQKIRVVFVHYEKTYLEQTAETKPKFVAAHGQDSTMFKAAKFSKEKKGHLHPNGNVIVECFDFYSFIINPDKTYRQALVSFRKYMDQKEAQRIITLVSNYREDFPDGNGGTVRKTPALFYRSWNLGTVIHSKDGNNWLGYKATVGPKTEGLFPDDPKLCETIYLDAREWRAAIKDGQVKVKNLAESEGEGGSNAATDESAPM
jgi:hypothetical protein